MPFLAFSAVLAGAVTAGWCFSRWIVGPADSRAFRAVLYLATGLLLIHCVLAWLDLGAVPWYAPPVAVIVASVALAARRFLGKGRRFGGADPPGAGGNGAPPGERALRLGWAALAGGAIVVFFAVLAVSERITFPDFVYHWGLKGHRYSLLRAIDYDFLGRDWNLVVHRDYPQLVPELYALQSMIAGRFSEPALLLQSAVWFAALLIAAREALAAWRVRPEVARPVFLVLALAIGVFAVGYLMAGSADWVVAFALTAALPALVRPPSVAGEVQLGILAALAASTKLEGIPLAALLILAGAWRRARVMLVPRRDVARASLDGVASGSIAGAVLRLALPSAIAVSPWLIQGLRHDLFRDPQGGALDVTRGPAIAAAVWQALLRPEWHLVSLAVLLLPLLFVRRSTRLAGAVIALQLAGYLLRYFTASFDYEFSVLSSFPRLVFHLLPAVVVGLAAAAAGYEARPARDGVSVVDGETPTREKTLTSAGPAAGTSPPDPRSTA